MTTTLIWPILTLWLGRIILKTRKSDKCKAYCTNSFTLLNAEGHKGSLNALSNDRGQGF